MLNTVSSWSDKICSAHDEAITAIKRIVSFNYCQCFSLLHHFIFRWNIMIYKILISQNFSPLYYDLAYYLFFLKHSLKSPSSQSNNCISHFSLMTTFIIYLSSWNLYFLIVLIFSFLCILFLMSKSHNNANSWSWRYKPQSKCLANHNNSPSQECYYFYTQDFSIIYALIKMKTPEVFVEELLWILFSIFS